MKTMGMINTINTTSLGFLLITSLEHHWTNRQQIHTTYNSEASISLLQTGGMTNTTLSLHTHQLHSWIFSHESRSPHHSHPLSTHLLLITTQSWQILQQRYYSSIHPQTSYQLKCELSSQMNYEFWMILTDCQYWVTSFHFLTNDNKCADRFLIGCSYPSVKAADTEAASTCYPRWSHSSNYLNFREIFEPQLAH